MAFEAGTQLGSYEIIAPLGAGGMGVVYKALDKRLNRPVALKFLPHDANVNQRDNDRLLKEARAASALDHPNIGTIHGIEQTPDGHLFIVMAFYDGETLQRKIRRGALPYDIALDYAIQMAQGLAAAHEKGIVHRDIKPGNVIVTSEGAVKVLDFGLALVSSLSSRTQSESISGTAQYMSPEQALGEKLDTRSDIFSFGLVLNEMLTGKQTFQGENIPAVLFAIVSKPPDGVALAPPELQPLIYRALAKDPAKRYQSMNDVLAELRPLKVVPNTITRSTNNRALQALVAGASGSAVLPRPASWNRHIGIGALGVAGLAGLLLSIPASREYLLNLGSPPPAHIAVLPIATVGKQQVEDALADGLLESLTGRLSNLESANGSLWIVPASEMRRRKINDATAARREFGANIVISGSLEKDGKTVRLMLNIIDAVNIRQLGAAIVEDPGGDLIALQDMSVARLAKLLRVTVRASGSNRADRTSTPAAYETYLKGVGFLRRYDKPGNLDAAIAAFEQAMAADTKDALALAGLGEAYWTKYTFDKDNRWVELAARYCRQATVLDDKLAPVHITLGRIHDLGGKPELALREFQQALDIDSRNAEAYVAQALTYEHMGRVKEAEADLQRAAALRPDYWDGYNKLGTFYLRQRRYAEALATMQHAIALTPDNSTAYINLGVIYYRMGKQVEAAEAYRKSITLSPNYGAYANLANIYSEKKDWAAAAEAQEKALQLNGNDFRVWLNLAQNYKYLGNLAKTRAAYEKAQILAERNAKLNPRDSDAQSGLAIIYLNLGQLEKARDAERTAIALSPNDPAVLMRAAITFENIGDRSEAMRLARKYLELGGALDTLKRSGDGAKILADPRFKMPDR